MLKILKFEWKRMISSKTMLISCLSAAVIIILDVISWFNLYQNGVDKYTSIFYKWLGVNRGTNSGVYFFMALPLLTAFAYSWTASYDRSSGYINQILSRCSRRKYFTAKYVVSFVSGGLIFAGALVFDYILLSTFSPAYQPIPGDLASSMDPFRFCSAIFYQNPYLFCFIWCCIAFLWGGAMACIGLATGMFLKKYIISSIVPFLIFMSESILAAYISRKYIITLNGCMVTLGWNDMLYAAPMTTSLPEHILSSIAFIVVFSTILYCLRGRKYECL